MADEPVVTEVPAKENRVDDRINQLSEKVATVSVERDTAKAQLGEKDSKIAELEREKSFSDGYADILATQPTAREHKDEIKAKVLSGMSVEDATFAVLGKAGKLSSPQTTTQVAGGSAATTMSQGEKPVSEMTQAEKRAILDKILIRG